MKYFILLFCLPCLAYDTTVIIRKNVPHSISREVVKDVISLNKAFGRNKFTFADSPLNYKIFFNFSPYPQGTVAGEAVSTVFYCDITIYPSSYPVFKTVVWHELGHCMGLKHKSKLRDVMSEMVDPFDSYTDEKLNEFIKDLKGVTQ